MKKITIITVVKNNKEGIEKTIKSVLSQTIVNKLEYIVIDSNSKDGALKAFKKGAFHLAKAGNAPIVPMHIEGTYDRLPSQSFLFRPSQKSIRVRIGQPMSSKHAGPDVLMAEARKRIESLSQ